MCRKDKKQGLFSQTSPVILYKPYYKIKNGIKYSKGNRNLEIHIFVYIKIGIKKRDFPLSGLIIIVFFEQIGHLVYTVFGQRLAHSLFFPQLSRYLQIAIEVITCFLCFLYNGIHFLL